MKKRLFTIIISILLLTSFQIPKTVYKKVMKEIKIVFNITKFSLTEVEIPKEQKTTLKIKNEILYKIKSNEQLLGYAYIDKADSKVDQFDYLIIFNSELIILKSKILIYREDYGSEISSKRWLKQFIGKTITDKLEYGNNIDGISGATISAKSMTYAVTKALKNLKELKESNIL